MKNNRQLLLLLLFLVGFSAYGQESVTDILASIEANNPTIAALKAQLDYQKAEARTNLLPPNPTIEGGRFPAVEGAGIKYAWGVSQSFEFPTVYAKRNQLAKTNDKLVDVNFKAARQEILLQATHVLLEYIQAKRMLTELDHRQKLASNMLNIIQKKVDAGQATTMELNNARLRLVEETQNASRVRSHKNILHRKMVMLNGGQELDATDSLLLLLPLGEKDTIFNQFAHTDPRFSATHQEVALAEQNKSLVTHQGLPELNIGYQSEQTDAEHFTGFKVGLSIPLWGNSGNRRAAAIQLNSSQAQAHNQRVMLEMEFEELYQQTVSTRSQLDELQKALTSNNNLELTRRALEAGEISVIDFFNEVTFLYGLTDRVMELELEYAKLYSELHRFEL
ncbi:MAG: TolC family protein [Tenuifilaceae bacterium]|jgi:outer membrane protein TolC|nr:TolC family protein [Tenuifilaceae bacterium]